MTSLTLPAGHHYAMMWGIPDLYAGMTNSMLHRCRGFVRLTGTPVTIVTYEWRESYDVVRERLRERGATIDGIDLINLWEQLAEFDDIQLATAGDFVESASVHFAPLGDRGDHAHPARNVLKDDSGTILQIDYFRADGTLMGSDRRDLPEPESRAFTLCDTAGKPLGTWTRVWSLYWWWLDTLPRDPVAWMISDSKTSANHLVDYRRDDVVVIHVVHGSHLAPGTGRPLGTLIPSRKRVFERLDQWDGVVFLTRQQMDEVEVLLDSGDNRHVIPHGRDVPSDPPTGERSALHGVMLTSLSKRKQIDHAIRAMAGAGWFKMRRPFLEVYGQGGQLKQLTDQVTKSHAKVALKGYRDDAMKEFERASFSLLTSSNEAFGLVLVESMARGCIPISYDMPYGPAEVITDGVDGFLVPADDIDALGSRIRDVVRTDAPTLDRMRFAAHQRALEFNDEHVTQQWINVMDAALASKRSAPA